MTLPMTWCGHLAALGSLLLCACTVANGQGAGVARGQQLLARYQCGSCHVIPGVAASRGQFAVSLASFGRRSYIAGRVANQPEMLARWIAAPASVVPGTLMPDMGVSAADARDMAAYLGTLR